MSYHPLRIACSQSKIVHLRYKESSLFTSSTYLGFSRGSMCFGKVEISRSREQRLFFFYCRCLPWVLQFFDVFGVVVGVSEKFACARVDKHSKNIKFWRVIYIFMKMYGWTVTCYKKYQKRLLFFFLFSNDFSDQSHESIVNQSRELVLWKKKKKTY